MSSTPRRVCLIANPHAGRKAAAEVCAAGIEQLQRSGVECELLWTQGPRHATQLVAELPADRFSAVGAVGGDGTAFEVVQGLFQRPPEQRLPLAFLPAGSGNSVALDLGWREPAPAFAALAADTRRPIDVAHVDLDGQSFVAVNVLAWGAGARINARAEGMRWARGRRYDLASVMELLSPRLAGSGARVDGQGGEHLLLGVAALTRHSGRGMCVAPMAQLDDGLLDLVTIAKGSRLTLARLLGKIYSGGHVGSPLVTCSQHPSLSLELDPGSHLVVDGELMPASKVLIRMEQGALEVFCESPRNPATP